MKLEEQVTSFELSKRLKELGAKQDTLFSWIEYTDGTFHVELTKWAKSQYYGGIGRKEKELFAALTVAELGEMLPTFYTSWRTADTWACGDELDQHGGKAFTTKTEAGARAKMLIWLIENKLVEGVENGQMQQMWT